MSKHLFTLFLLATSISLHADPSKTSPLEAFLKKHQLPYPKPGTLTKQSCVITTKEAKFILKQEDNGFVFYQNGKKLKTKKIIAFLNFCAAQQAQSDDTDNFDFDTIFAQK